MTTNPYEAFDNALDSLQDGADLIAHHVNKDTTLTEEGKDENYTHHTKDHREYLDYLEERVEDFEAEAANNFDNTRAAILPTPQGDTGTLAAELQAQRIMNRAGMDEVNTVWQWVKDTPASPSRTLVLEELQARGVLKPDIVDAMLLDSHPEYADATRGLNRTREMVNHAYRSKIAAARRRLDNRRAEGRKLTEQHTSAIWAHELPGTKHVDVVQPWKGNQVEHVYRQR